MQETASGPDGPILPLWGCKLQHRIHFILSTHGFSHTHGMITEKSMQIEQNRVAQQGYQTGVTHSCLNSPCDPQMLEKLFQNQLDGYILTTCTCTLIVPCQILVKPKQT